MKLLFVCKRHPQQRDLIERPYGRFYHLPRLLAHLGHEVRVALCSHRDLPSVAIERDGILWTSDDVRTLGPMAVVGRLQQETERWRPDWIIGCSDTWYGWLAQRLARSTGARLAIDAYDNYEAYMPWNLPLHWAWRRAISAANVVTAAGPQLAMRLDVHRQGKLPTAIVPMAADPQFGPLDRVESRAALGLPAGAPLIGYTGGWSANRGTLLLLDAFDRIRHTQPEARLVLSGRPPAEVRNAPGVIALGYLEDTQLPVLLNAMNVACVVTANTGFGRFSYPSKLCEAMACDIPVVASATDALTWMLHGELQHLAKVGNPQEFASRVVAQLEEPSTNYPPRIQWWDVARKFELLLQD